MSVLGLSSASIYRTFRDGLGSHNDIPVVYPSPPAPDLNLNTDGLLETIRSSGIDITQVVINPLSPDITEVVIPGGFADIPVFSDEATNVFYANSPLLQQLIERGAVVLVEPNTGIDYRAAFNQLPGTEGSITVKSRSGADIAIHTAKDYIRVNDAYYETPAQMWANLTPQGTLQFGIYTRTTDDGKLYHRDLYAGEFYNAAIEYFGSQVTGIEGSWSHSSTNTKVVNQLLRQGVSLEDAIRQTFTGRHAIKHGFSEIVIENVEWDTVQPGLYKKILVLFKRPQQISQYRFEYDLGGENLTPPMIPSWVQIPS